MGGGLQGPAWWGHMGTSRRHSQAEPLPPAPPRALAQAAALALAAPLAALYPIEARSRGAFLLRLPAAAGG